MPGYAVAICHASVANGIVRDLGLAEQGGGLARAGRKARDAAALRAALTKVAWLDLELILEPTPTPKARAAAPRST